MHYNASINRKDGVIMKSSKFKILISTMLALILCCSSVSAMACTAIYVGSDLTSDGSTIFAR